MTIEALRKQACCFTGHREIPLLFRPLLKRRLEATVRRLADEGIVYFIAGGALGFDTMAALEVLRMKRSHPQIRS